MKPLLALLSVLVLLSSCNFKPAPSNRRITVRGRVERCGPIYHNNGKFGISHVAYVKLQGDSLIYHGFPNTFDKFLGISQPGDSVAITFMDEFGTGKFTDSLVQYDNGYRYDNIIEYANYSAAAK